MSNFILIDGSYFIFYRYYAVKQWFKFSHPEEKTETDALHIDFINKFKTTFHDKMLEIPKKLNIENPITLVGKDCPRKEIWRMKKLITLMTAAVICFKISTSHAADVEVTWLDPTCGFFVVKLPEGSQEEAFGLFSARALPQPTIGDFLKGDMTEIETTLLNLRTDERHTVIHWADAKLHEQLVRNTPVQCASKWKNRKKR